MSRVFVNDIANFLTVAPTALAQAAEEYAIFGWIKDSGSGEFNRYPISVGGSQVTPGNRQHSIGTRSGNEFRMFVSDAASNTVNTAALLSPGAWQFVLLQRFSDGAGGYTHTLRLGDQEIATVAGTSGSGIQPTFNGVTIGCNSNVTGPFNGKVAHAGVFLRSLTTTEQTQLASGVSPESIDATGRYAYYPMTGSSLDNEWFEESDVGALSVIGSVSADDSDNPVVDAPALIPSITITSTTPITPGSTVTGTYAHFNVVPTAASISDGSNSLTSAAGLTGFTVNDTDTDGVHSGTFSFVMPSLPTSGTRQMILFGQATVELT